jgi:hypothetical protein
MKDVTVLKHGKFNLFSIPKMLTQGWKLGGDGEQIWIFKEDAHIDFDIKIPTPKGALYVMYFKCSMETGLTVTSTEAKMPMVKAHELLGPRANQEKGVAQTDGSAHSQVLREFTTRSPVEKTNKIMTKND